MRVPVLSLKSICSRISKPCLLKLDCEGCEFDLVQNEYAIPKSFEMIMIEYHAYNNPLSNLVRVLSRDFNITFVRVESCEPHLQGLMYCTRTHS